MTRDHPDFRAEIVVRTGESERRMLIARTADMQRMDMDVGTDAHRAVLLTDKEYLIFFKRKLFEEREMSASAESMFEPLTSHILSVRDYASFDEISRSGAVVQYRAQLNDSANSEVLIFFDESIGLPVKQEFYGVEGDKRTLQYSVELKDFRTQADAELFTVPKNFRRQATRK